MANLMLLQGTALALPLKDASVHTVCTSPPYYGLRSYGIGEGELGLEPTLEAYVAAMVQVFREVKRVLRNDGILFLNMGDSYAGASVLGDARPGSGLADGIVDDRAQRNRNGLGSIPGLPAKNLMGMPWRIAFALQNDGWILRSDIIWDKPSCMPESVQDRPTRSHEYVFLFAKQARYFYDAESVKEMGAMQYGENRKGTLGRGPISEPSGMIAGLNHSGPGFIATGTRNARTVWRIPSEPFSGSHFATFPTALVRRCLLAGAPTQVCATCQAPWRRQMEKPEGYPKGSYHDHELDGIAYGLRQKGRGPANLPPGMQPYTTGFSPTCHCAAGTQPCTVLDPFCGSGTTLLVARELGHHAIGIDLSYPYLHDIARQRLGLTALKAWQDGAAPRQERFDDLPLFDVSHQIS